MKKFFFSLVICTLTIVTRAATSGDVVTYLGTTTNATIEIDKSPYYWVPSTNCRFAMSGTLNRTNATKRLQLTINASSGFVVTNVVDSLSSRTTWGQLYTGLNTVFLQWNGAQWEVWQDPAARDESIDYGISTTQVATNTLLQSQITAGTSATLYRTATPVVVGNTVTETTILTNTLTAGVLGTNKAIRIELSGDVLNNTAGASNFNVKVYLGTTTIANMNTAAMSQNIVRRQYAMTIEIENINSASVQRCFVSKWILGAAATAAIATTALTVSVGETGTAAENSANALGLGVTVTPSVQSSNLEWNAEYGSVTLY